MSWNIEIVCIRDRKLDLEDAVPDVFGPTKARYHFEGATSAQRDEELCAARIREWIVIIDVGCRVSRNDEYLEEISTGREVHVFRVADAPLHLHYLDGAKQRERQGLQACVRALTGKASQPKDGELVAQDLLREVTRLDFGRELWDAKYRGFALD